MSKPPHHPQPDSPRSDSLSYRDAGVDINAGNELIERIKPAVKRTLRPEVLAGLGGFGGLFELPLERYRQPVLVSGTDGVGTKLKLAQQLGIHDTIGIDLVAMCVNDIVVSGAEPLFFLDYFACGTLSVDEAAQVIEGIAQGCEQAGAALIGGETAEMPGMYQAGEYDLAGFAVGIVEKSHMLDASNVQAGDVILGLASSGAHSNGYSLIRKVLDTGKHNLEQSFADSTPGNSTLGETLLAPTQIYVKTLLPLTQAGKVHALAHITGGGISENLPRVLPTGTKAVIDKSGWTRPEIFNWLQTEGNIEEAEMLRTFNCGIGMALIAPATEVDAIRAQCTNDGIDCQMIGKIETTTSAPLVEYK